jgi:hypothetical protein
MEKQRIQFYTDPRMKRRIKQAAAKHKIPVSQYLLSAIEQQLANDEGSDQAQRDQGAIAAAQDHALIEDLRKLHEDIRASPLWKNIDIDADLTQMREERDHDLTRWG